jgi:hypothetical protein
MTRKPDDGTPQTQAEAREKRRAEALRANLRRRKAAKPAETAQKPEPTGD